MRFLFIIFLSLFIGSCHVKNYNNVPELRAIAAIKFIDKEYESAISTLNILLKVDPDNKAEYLYERGACYSLLKEFNKANRDLKNSISNNFNKSQYAYKYLAENAIRESNDTTMALKYINNAYKIDPNDESVIMFKLILMDQKSAIKFTLDSLIKQN